MKTNPHLHAAIMEIVENQLKSNDPPETKTTFNRLIAEGHSKKEAKRLIACVVSSEIFDILKNEEQFNQTRFIKALDNLPEMPWEE